MGRFDLDLEQYARLARHAAAEGAVLLKNERGALPLRHGDRLAVFGRIQRHYYKSGTGSGGLVNTRYVVGILDALQSCPDLHIHRGLAAAYENWVADHPFDPGAGWAGEPWCQEEMPLDDTLVNQAASEADVALVIIGRSAGEDKDNSAVPGSYLLTAAEEEMLAKVCRAFRRTVVVLNVGNIIDMKWVAAYDPAAVLYAWHGGQEGGNAVLDVLTGAVNPCGKLTDTIARDIADYPAHGNFGDATRNVYEEDIFVGYRWFETAARDKVLYPFGFGLSYTGFRLETRSFAAGEALANSQVRLTVRVTNSGAAAGKEVVQVYASAPQGRLGRPARELKAFAKTPLLAPGEWVDLELTVAVADLAAYDDDGSTGQKSAWVLEAGSYAFLVGSDARSAAPVGSLEIPSLLVVGRCIEALTPRLSHQRRRARPAAGGGVEFFMEDSLVRGYDLARRIRDGRVPAKPCIGDRGLKLADVLDGRADMGDFLAQLEDLDLVHLSRGEGMSSPKVTPGTAGAFGGVTERLKGFGIPVACCADGPSGIRMDCGAQAFSLPNGTCLASSFNTGLVRELYTMTGLELRRNRIDAILGPGMNIHRHPLNGRNFEYFSEDPLLTGRMAVACLEGLHEYGVTGTIKHFAGNNQEKGRGTGDSVVSERALREIYLKGFEMAVKEGKATTVMSTYGALNGIWTAGNYDLLTTVLRRDWGFAGLVMTDWWAKINEDGEAEASSRNTHYMVRAQNELYMVTNDSAANTNGDLLEEGLRQGMVTRGDLVRNAANICRVVMALPVMQRFLGRSPAEELAAAESSSAETAPFDLVYQPVDRELSLDLAGLTSTARGASALFALHFAQPGKYDITLRLRSEAGELAQMPVTIFRDGWVAAAITVTGTGGRWIEETRDLGEVHNPNLYLKLYFGQGGLEIGEIKVKLRKEG